MILRAAARIPGLGVPMLSVLEGRRLRVSLGGVPQKNAVGYDIDRGVVWRYKTNLDGQYLLDRGYPIVEERRGEVVVKEVK